MNNLDSVFKNKKNNFDFIRFLASILVIYSHSFEIVFSPNKDQFYQLSNGKITFGNLSVAVFFIISGYLISQSYMRSKDSFEYLLSRCLRIFPGLFFVLLLTAFLVGPFVSKLTLNDYFRDINTYLYLQKIFLFRASDALPGVFVQNRLKEVANGSLWTLSYEFIMYFLVLITGLFIKNKPKIAIIIMILVFLVFHNYVFNYYFFLFGYYFLMGFLCFYFRRYILLSWRYLLLALGVFFVSLVYIENKEINFILTGVSWSYIIMYFAYNEKIKLSNFAAYGDFSYGIYIWGFLIQQTFTMYFPSWNNYYNFFASSVVSIIISYFSWHLIERKFIGLKTKILLLRKTELINE